MNPATRDSAVPVAVTPPAVRPRAASFPRSRTRQRRLVFLAGLALLGLHLAIGLAVAYDATVELLGAVAISALAAGKFLPLWGVSGQSSYSPFELGLLVWLMDTASCLIVLYAHDRLCRIRAIGRLFDRARERADALLDAYPSARKGAVVAVVVFVLFPLAGTGATVGAFLGLLLGLHRHVVIAAVSAGGFLGGMLMALLAVHASDAVLRLRDLAQCSTFKYACLAALVALAILLARRLRREWSAGRP